MVRDPRPWQRTLAELPPSVRVISFEWWYDSDRPRITICVRGWLFSLQPTLTFQSDHLDAYSIYAGTAEATSWTQQACVTDQDLAQVAVADRPRAVIAALASHAIVVAPWSPPEP